MVCTQNPNTSLKLTPSGSQIILLPTGPRVLVQSPLNIAIFVLESASSDLKTSHRHPRSNFCQFNTLIPSLDENVMANLDIVLDVLECDNSASELGLICDGFSRREDMLQDLDDAKTESGCEALEDEVGVGLANSPAGAVRDVVA